MLAGANTPASNTTNNQLAVRRRMEFLLRPHTRLQASGFRIGQCDQMRNREQGAWRIIRLK